MQFRSVWFGNAHGLAPFLVWKCLQFRSVFGLETLAVSPPFGLEIPSFFAPFGLEMLAFLSVFGLEMDKFYCVFALDLQIIVLTLQKLGGTQPYENKFSWPSLALTLHSSCTIITKSKAYV